jgi:hypothetical protein
MSEFIIVPIRNYEKMKNLELWKRKNSEQWGPPWPWTLESIARARRHAWPLCALQMAIPETALQLGKHYTAVSYLLGHTTPYVQSEAYAYASDWMHLNKVSS